MIGVEMSKKVDRDLTDFKKPRTRLIVDRREGRVVNKANS
jgi:hypothetical protein